MKKTSKNSANQSGFSLIELILAMTITLVVLAIASTLLASSFQVRSRENARSIAIAAAQRTLNIMSREIANAGYGLSSNGIVTGGDSGAAAIRVRSDLNLSGATNVIDEDIKYIWVSDANGNSIVRLNLQPAQTTSVVASGIDGLRLYYFNERVTYTIGNCGTGACGVTDFRNAAGNVEAECTPDLATYIVLALRVTLPQVGTPRSPGYQPASATQLVSSITLRNSNLGTY